jgi:hypothetical protein
VIGRKPRMAPFYIACNGDLTPTAGAAPSVPRARGFTLCEQSLFAHSHQDAYLRRKRYTEQLARIDAIFVIDAQEPYKTPNSMRHHSSSEIIN